MNELLRHFQMMARYNRLANELLFAKCAELNDAEYRRQRDGSFGSIHALLNHILLGDRIWMSRFEGGGQTTPRLSAILYDDFAELRGAREKEDARIEAFFRIAEPASLDRQLSYTNSQGKHYVDYLPISIGHLFNHQTHHRGQVHVMLAQTSVQPPSLDLHRAINP